MLEIEERYKKNWTDLLFTKQIYGYQKNLIYCSINGHSTEWVKKSSKWKDQKSASKPGRVRLKVFYLGVSEYYMIFAAFLGRLIFTLRFIVRKNKDFFLFIRILLVLNAIIQHTKKTSAQSLNISAFCNNPFKDNNLCYERNG